jgi:hypothetical protein
MEAIYLLLSIVIMAVLLGITLGAVAMKILNNRSPVDRLVNRRHFGGA